MAQLKNTLIQGSARVTGTLYANTLDGALNVSNLTGLGTEGQVLTVGTTGVTWTTPSAGVSLASQTAQVYLTGATGTSATSLQLTGAYVTTAGALYSTTVHNAVWNDYAEYRRAREPIAPGRVVVDTDEGAVVLASSRLQPGAQIVSDTWGHIMGETEQAKTPIAVAGRVLVYPYRDRRVYRAGMTVCSAPNGTVDFMTRDEIKNYPDCIVGIVSEIPTYETWGEGNVKVDGRIWVRVK